MTYEPRGGTGWATAAVEEWAPAVELTRTGAAFPHAVELHIGFDRWQPVAGFLVAGYARGWIGDRRSHEAAGAFADQLTYRHRDVNAGTVCDGSCVGARRRECRWMPL